MKFLEECSKARVLVIGDVILDKYIFGSVDRISPEAPVPILLEDSVEYRLGGAANVAANIVSLGGHAELVGYFANDIEGQILSQKCRDFGIYPTFIEAFKNTLTKTRLISGRHQMMRFDREDSEFNEDPFKELFTRIESLIPSCDVIVISDYAKGVVTQELMDRLKAKKCNKPVIIDPKPSNMSFYKDVYLITPNRKESLEMSKLGKFNEVEVANCLSSMLNSNILITLGSNGMYLKYNVDKSEGLRMPTKAEEVFDVTGAGDTVVACVSLAIACGMELTTACQIANEAAGIVVGHVGTAAITREELEKVLKF